MGLKPRFPSDTSVDLSPDLQDTKGPEATMTDHREDDYITSIAQTVLGVRSNEPLNTATLPGLPTSLLENSQNQ